MPVIKHNSDQANQDELYSGDGGYCCVARRRPFHGARGRHSRCRRLNAVTSHVTMWIVDDPLRSRQMALFERVPLMSAFVAITVAEPSDAAIPAAHRYFQVGWNDAAGHALQQLDRRADVHHLAAEVVALFSRLGEPRLDWRQRWRAADACGPGAVGHVRLAVQGHAVHRLARCVVLLPLMAEASRQFSTREFRAITRCTVEWSWTLHSRTSELTLPVTYNLKESCRMHLRASYIPCESKKVAP